ncbi:LPXTG cell wall anchor domain-containing protein [Staphylococcus sp. EG-SA-13]|nr:LPXTG cell wall anchor domain-containing protein [Staphylococcus sp. EG-SA-13]
MAGTTICTLDVNTSTSSSGDAMTYALIFSGAVLLLAGSFFLGKKRASK